MKQWLSTLRTLGIVLVAIVGIAGAQYASDATKTAVPPGPVVAFPVPVLRSVNMGLNTATASALWMNVVLELGTFHIGYNGIMDDITSITTLDEKFAYPYAFCGLLSGIFQEQDQPRALALAAVGVERKVPDYRIPYYLGMAYHMKKDRENALKYFGIAAQMPDLPEPMRPTVINYGTHGTNRSETKALWEAIYETSKDDFVVENAKKNIQHIALLDAIDEAVAAYHSDTGEYPKDIAALVKGKYLPGTPRDPFGLQFTIGGDGKVGQKMP